MNAMQMRSSRILVVDDERNIALSLCKILHKEGYDVAACFSGEEAVEKAATLLPNLLLSDISMGSMNGVEAAARITVKLPDCRILFHSGHPSMDVVVEKIPQNLVYSFMSKPTSVPDLLKAIACMLPTTNTPEHQTDVELPHDPMELRTLAKTAIGRLDALGTGSAIWSHRAVNGLVAVDESERSSDSPSLASHFAPNGRRRHHSHQQPNEDVAQTLQLTRIMSLVRCRQRKFPTVSELL